MFVVFPFFFSQYHHLCLSCRLYSSCVWSQNAFQIFVCWFPPAYSPPRYFTVAARASAEVKAGI